MKLKYSLVALAISSLIACGGSSSSDPVSSSGEPFIADKAGEGTLSLTIQSKNVCNNEPVVIDDAYMLIQDEDFNTVEVIKATSDGLLTFDTDADTQTVTLVYTTPYTNTPTLRTFVHMPMKAYGDYVIGEYLDNCERFDTDFYIKLADDHEAYLPNATSHLANDNYDANTTGAGSFLVSGRVPTYETGVMLPLEVGAIIGSDSDSEQRQKRFQLITDIEQVQSQSEVILDIYPSYIPSDAITLDGVAYSELPAEMLQTGNIFSSVVYGDNNYFRINEDADSLESLPFYPTDKADGYLFQFHSPISSSEASGNTSQIVSRSSSFLATATPPTELNFTSLGIEHEQLVEFSQRESGYYDFSSSHADAGYSFTRFIVKDGRDTTSVLSWWVYMPNQGRLPQIENLTIPADVLDLESLLKGVSSMRVAAGFEGTAVESWDEFVTEYLTASRLGTSRNYMSAFYDVEVDDLPYSGDSKMKALLNAKPGINNVRANISK